MQNDRADALDKMLRQRFSRSAPIEEALMNAGMGKRPLPTVEECKAWAVALGVPDDVRASLSPEQPEKPEAVETGEPVVWRVRLCYAGREWFYTANRDEADAWRAHGKYEVQPLYAFRAALAAIPTVGDTK